jgi:hypothetical protein
VILLKFAVAFATITALYHISGVFDFVMWPLKPLLAEKVPEGDDASPLHEWQFRTGLDQVRLCNHARFCQLINSLSSINHYLSQSLTLLFPS